MFFEVTGTEKSWSSGKRVLTKVTTLVNGDSITAVRKKNKGCRVYLSSRHHSIDCDQSYAEIKKLLGYKSTCEQAFDDASQDAASSERRRRERAACETFLGEIKKASKRIRKSTADATKKAAAAKVKTVKRKLASRKTSRAKKAS